MSPSRCMKTWATLKAKKSQDACLPSVSPSHFKQIPIDHMVQAFQVQVQAISSKEHFIIIKVQAHQASNGPRRSKWPNFASLNIWFATSWLNLNFVCLFHISIFLWILKIHVPFDVLCSCIYIFFKIQKKKIQESQIFPKKR